MLARNISDTYSFRGYTKKLDPLLKERIISHSGSLRKDKEEDEISKETESLLKSAFERDLSIREEHKQKSKKSVEKSFIFK